MNHHEGIKVFIVEDDPVFALMIEEKLKEAEGVIISTFDNGRDFLETIKQHPDIVILDYNLPEINGMDVLKQIKKTNPSTDVIFISSQQDVHVVVNAYKEGARKYIVKDEHALIEILQTVNLVKEHVRLQKEVRQLKQQLLDRSKYNTLVGESPALLHVLKLIQKVENNDIVVLITGESGTGKEIVAHAIHENSKRRKKPFVAVNMAAIPEDLIESELFGHEKGAFTGAGARRIGKFEEANGGSLFLDEIGEMDIHLQTKLLRVLQDNKISRLGSNREIRLDVRIITATNTNLYERVKSGKFREDLYYRINGFLIHLPPLRERGNDVIVLARYFLEAFCKKNKMRKKILSNSAVEALIKHSWPGNVRELKSVIERAALISDNDVVHRDDIIF